MADVEVFPILKKIMLAGNLVLNFKCLVDRMI